MLNFFWGVEMKNMKYKSAYVLLLFLFNAVIIFSDAKPISPADEEYLINVEKQAAPVDGLNGIYKKLVYPKFAMVSKTEGKVYLLLFINEKGDVDEVKLVKGIGGGCDEEAIKVLQKTKFIPAVQAGANVKSKLPLAISFKLS
jgi:periplasmic protein TonB